MHAKQNQDLGIASNEGRESYTTAKDSLVRVCIGKKNNIQKKFSFKKKDNLELHLFNILI